MTQWAKHGSLDVGLGGDLKVCEFKPYVGLCGDSAEPPWDFLSPTLSLPFPRSCFSLCLSKLNKLGVPGGSVG